jgi:hypothetical protein
MIAKLIRLAGLVTTGVFLFYYVLSKFIITQSNVVKLSVAGVILGLIIFAIFMRYGKLWLQNKLNAIATAKELSMNGKTKPLFQVILTMFYIFYPSLLVVVFLYGMAQYNGILWLDILKLLGILSIYFVFEFVALWQERMDIRNKELKKYTQEQEELAERVAKKMNYSVK